MIKRKEESRKSKDTKKEKKEKNMKERKKKKKKEFGYIFKFPHCPLASKNCFYHGIFFYIFSSLFLIQSSSVL